MVAPQWSSFTRAVRNDPTAFNLTGDMHTRAHGDKPWIAEMCASLNVARAICTVQKFPVSALSWCVSQVWVCPGRCEGQRVAQPCRLLPLDVPWLLHIR